MEVNMTRTYPYTPKNPLKQTPFSEKWGILSKDLAFEEGTTTAAIHMRVRNFGNPFQRKKSPTICEVMTGRTAIDLAHELNVTPCTISQRIKDYGNPYYDSGLPQGLYNRGVTRADVHWSKTKQGGVAIGTKQGWLSPRHPEYHTWRYRYIQKHCPTSCDDGGDTK
jgi:hypothetical protein